MWFPPNGMFTFGSDPEWYCGGKAGVFLKTERKSSFTVSCANNDTKIFSKQLKTRKRINYTSINTPIVETSFIISSKARVSSACFWLCSAIFSENFRGFAILELSKRVVSSRSAFQSVTGGLISANQKAGKQYAAILPSRNANILYYSFSSVLLAYIKHVTYCINRAGNGLSRSVVIWKHL